MKVVNWLRIKHTSIMAAIGVVIAAGIKFGWWTLSETQINYVMGLAGLLWLFIGQNTNTANLRISDKAWGGPSGVDV